MTGGLGRPHRRERAALPDPDGQPCPFCGFAMWTDDPDDPLDADHFPPRALAGGAPTELRWSHAVCNRSAGAALGNYLRSGVARPVDTRRNTERWS